MTPTRISRAAAALCAVGLGLGPAAFAQYALPGASGERRLPGASALNREAGAIYIEELLEKPLKLKVLRETPVYLQLDGKRNIGMLVPGGEVELLALSDKAYRVRGRARHDQVAGWVRPSDLDGMTEDLKENLKKVYERAVLVEDLISQKQVALGMTLDEVARSLGQPTSTESKIEKEGRKDTFNYITYENVAQQGPLQYGPFGQVYSSIVYVKVETGRVSIHFENEMVTSIAESEGVPTVGGSVKIVPSPIVLY